MLFSLYPYQNFSDYNLDFIIKKIKEISETLNNFIAFNSIKYADPILWDITNQYEGNTVVINPYDGNAYISTQAVPSGVNINNTDYWTPIFNYEEELDRLREQIVAVNEHYSATATEARNEGDLIWLGGFLYKVLYDIAAGTEYIVDTNIEGITIEELIDELNDKVNPLIVKVYAMSTWYTTPEEYGAVGDGVTDDTEAFTNALNDDRPVILADGKEYLITGDVTINKDFFGYGKILTDDTVFIEVPDNTKLTLNGNRVTRNWTGNDKPIFHFKTRTVGCNVTVLHCEGGYIGLKFTDVVMHNVFIVTNIVNNVYHIHADNLNGGWFNENTFIGGRFTNYDLTEAELLIPSYGIYFKDANTGSPFNGNYFIKPCLQSISYGIYCENSRMNTFEGCRFEDANNDIIFAHFDSKSFSNRVTTGYTNTEINFEDNGLNELRPLRYLYQWMTPYQISGYNDKLIYMKATDRLSLKNMVAKDDWQNAPAIGNKYALATNGTIDNKVGLGFKFAKSEATVFNIRCKDDNMPAFVSFHNADGTEATIEEFTFPDVGGTRWAKYNQAYRTTGYTKNASFRVIGDYDFMIIGMACLGTANPEDIVVSANAPTVQLAEREYYEQLYQTAYYPEEGDLLMAYDNGTLKMYSKLDSRIGYATLTVQP